jgi:hypothetical protein
MGSVVYSSDGGQWYTVVMGVCGIQQCWVSVVYNSNGSQWYTAVKWVSVIQQ